MPTSLLQDLRRKFPVKDGSSGAPAVSPAATTTPTSVIHHISIDDIIPNRSQPRSNFNQNAILRLSDSIRRYGILQPLTVRKMLIPAPFRPQDGTPQEHYAANTAKSASESTYLPPSNAPTVLYELIAGERRLRAARLAELTCVPCIIINTDDSTSAELAIIENLLREDLNMFEQAEAFRRLIDEFMLTQEEVARRVSLSQSAVANKLRILRLSAEERRSILQAGLTERHARALLKLSDPELRGQALSHIILRKCNVSASEAYIDDLLNDLCRQKAKETLAERQNAAESSKSPTQGNQVSLHTDETAGDDRSSGKRKGAIRDIRLFYNSIRNAASILEQTGLHVQCTQQETPQEICITLCIRQPGEDKDAQPVDQAEKRST